MGCLLQLKHKCHLKNIKNKGMRAVIPGFIDYFFKNGTLPGHTKSTFIGYRILTALNIISLNAF